MDSLEESGLAVPGISKSHGSSELSAALDTGMFKSSRGTVPKYEPSSNGCWRESGVVGPFEAERNGWCETGRSIMLG